MRTAIDTALPPHAAQGRMCHRERHGYGHHLENVGSRNRWAGYGHLKRAERQWNVQQYPGDRDRIRCREWRISGRVDCSNDYYDDYDDYDDYADDCSDDYADYADEYWPFTGNRYTTRCWMGVGLTASSFHRPRHRSKCPGHLQTRNPAPRSHGTPETGTFNENDCQPNYAQGTFTSIPASALVSHPDGRFLANLSGHANRWRLVAGVE